MLLTFYVKWIKSTGGEICILYIIIIYLNSRYQECSEWTDQQSSALNQTSIAYFCNWLSTWLQYRSLHYLTCRLFPAVQIAASSKAATKPALNSPAMKGVDSKLASLILDEIIDGGAGVSFNDIAGLLVLIDTYYSHLMINDEWWIWTFATVFSRRNKRCKKSLSYPCWDQKSLQGFVLLLAGFCFSALRVTPSIFCLFNFQFATELRIILIVFVVFFSWQEMVKRCWHAPWPAKLQRPSSTYLPRV